MLCSQPCVPTISTGPCPPTVAGPYAAWMPRKRLQGCTCGVSREGGRARALQPNHKPALCSECRYQQHCQPHTPGRQTIGSQRQPRTNHLRDRRSQSQTTCHFAREPRPPGGRHPGARQRGKPTGGASMGASDA
ncbi:hypothetical protein XarbCFBP8132_08495 [Xanthomonas arboricola]|nr:hypothetical protein XarbCFBP8132_08495 [Xanthomonas arboricola]